MSDDLTRIEAILQRPVTIGEQARAIASLIAEEVRKGDNHHNAARCPYCNPTLDADLATAHASARRAALEEAAVVASAKLHIPKGTYIEPEFDNYQGGLRDAAQTIAVRLRAMAKHGGVE